MSLNMRLIAVLSELMIALLPIACGLEASAFNDGRTIFEEIEGGNDYAVLGGTVSALQADGIQSSLPQIVGESRFRNAILNINASEIVTEAPVRAPLTRLDRINLFFRCGDLGEDCCRAPIQNVSAFGPLVSCNEGLGCDITTNKCVSTCGGLGQVCCDGPETRAPKWTEYGKIYSPNSLFMREMCDTGVCDKQTHRCIACGTKEGAPCCPPDAAQATARCFKDANTGKQLVCNGLYAGECIECGKLNRPSCPGGTPCEYGLAERASDGICVSAGGPDEPCWSDGRCGYQGLFCNNNRICKPCGQPGEVCCPAGSLPGDAPCQEPGECRDNRCIACGYDNMPVCSSGDPCRTLSEPVNGWCRPCGNEGQSCCQSSTIITRCVDGLRCDDGVCRRPTPPTPPSPPTQWKTCNGENWSLSTMERTVFIKNTANQCIASYTYNANSAQEAYTCAQRDWREDAGFSVVTEPVDEYKFALTSQFGCHTVRVWGTDESEAQTCAQSQCINCIVTPGDCP